MTLKNLDLNFDLDDDAQEPENKLRTLGAIDLSPKSKDVIKPKTRKQETGFSVLNEPENDIRTEFGSLGVKNTTPSISREAKKGYDLGFWEPHPDKVRARDMVREIGLVMKNVSEAAPELIAESRLGMRIQKPFREKTEAEIMGDTFEAMNTTIDKINKGEIKPENTDSVINATRDLYATIERTAYQLDDPVFEELEKNEPEVLDRFFGTARDVASIASLGTMQWITDSSSLAASSLKEFLTGEQLEIPQTWADAGLADKRKIDTYESRVEDCIDRSGNYIGCPAMVGGFAVLDAIIVGGVVKNGFRKVGQNIVVNMPKSARGRTAMRRMFALPAGYTSADVQGARNSIVDMYMRKGTQAPGIRAGEGTVKEKAQRILRMGKEARLAKKRKDSFNMSMKLLDELERTADVEDLARYSVMSKSKQAVRTVGEALIDISTKPISEYKMGLGLSIEDVNKVDSIRKAKTPEERGRMIDELSPDEVRRIAQTTEGNNLIREVYESMSEQAKDKLFKDLTFPESQVPELEEVFSQGYKIADPAELEVDDTIRIANDSTDYRVAEFRENNVIEYVNTEDQTIADALAEGLSATDPSLIGLRERIQLPAPDRGMVKTDVARTDVQIEADKAIVSRGKNVEAGLDRVMEDLTPKDVFDDVRSFVADNIEGVEIQDMAVYGSRALGQEEVASDLDVVMEYTGDISEDQVFNQLNTGGVSFVYESDATRLGADVNLDINPIKINETGTLDDFLVKEEVKGAYLRESELDEYTNIREDPEVQPDMYAVHNVSTEKMRKIKAAGGLPVPSIAVLNRPWHFNNFGEIQLIASPDLVDPYDPSAKVFAGDVYSPVTPAAVYKPNDEKLNNLVDDLRNTAEEIKTQDGTDFTSGMDLIILELNTNEFNNRLPENPERGIKTLADSVIFERLVNNKEKQGILDKKERNNFPNENMYLEERARKYVEDILGEPLLRRKGVKGELKRLGEQEPYVGHLLNNPEIDTWHDFRMWFSNDPESNDVINRVADEIFDGDIDRADEWVNLELEEDFYQYELYNDVKNLTNRVLDDIKKQVSDVRGGETGSPPARVFGAREFRAIDEIKKSAGLLTDNGTAINYGMHAASRVDNYLESIGFEYDPNVSDRRVIPDIVREKLYNKPDALAKLINSYKQKDSAGISGNEAKEVARLTKQAYVDIPTDYFEAKILRSVELGEFKGAVAPEHLRYEIEQLIKNTELEGMVEYYDTAPETIDISGKKKNKKDAYKEWERKHGKASFSSMPFGLEAILSGVDQDEEGNMVIDPLKLGLGVIAGVSLRKITSPKPARPFEGLKDVTLKTVEKLKGKTLVARQFINDLAKAPDLKQTERDIIRKTLDDMQVKTGEKVDVEEFANRVKTELIPLEDSRSYPYIEPRYENIVLPESLRGDVEKYKEVIYTSPIKTSAGEVHFSGIPEELSNYYFAHIRSEDLPTQAVRAPKDQHDIVAGEKVRRVLEIQSDLFQKGGVARNVGTQPTITAGATPEEALKSARERGAFPNQTDRELLEEFKGQFENFNKLSSYRNTWFERIIREEIRSAAQDDINRLQFPTGETAMKIEGLAGESQWMDTEPAGAGINRTSPRAILDTQDINAGSIITMEDRETLDLADQYVVTDVLIGGDSFNAIRADDFMTALEQSKPPHELIGEIGITDEDVAGGLNRIIELDTSKELVSHFDSYREVEEFRISTEADPENPIFKFYQKDIQKFLKREFGQKGVIYTKDQNEVEWFEVDVPKEKKQLPVEAFAGALGSQVDEDGEFHFSPEGLLLGFMAMGFAKRVPMGGGLSFKGEQISARRLFRGANKKVTEVRKSFKKALAVSQDQHELVRQFANAGDNEASAILKDLDFFSIADKYLAKQLSGDFDAIQYKNEHLPQKGVEYHDLKTGEFYSENRTTAEVYAMQARDAKYKGDFVDKKLDAPDDDLGAVFADIFDASVTPDKQQNVNKVGQYTRNDLEEAQMRLSFLQDAVQAHQAKPLVKYERKQGDYKGGLPEVTGETGKGEFVRRGDDIVTEYGFADTEEARAAFEDYKIRKKELEEYREEIKEIRNDIKAAKENDRFIADTRKEIEKRVSDAMRKVLENQKLQAKLEKQREKGYKQGMKAGRAEAKRQVIAQLRNTFDVKIRYMKRSQELEQLRGRILQREIERKRKMIVDYASMVLPKSERGALMNKAFSARTRKDLIKAFTKIDNKAIEIEKKQLIAHTQKVLRRINRQKNVIAVDYRQAINAIASRFDFKKRRPDTIQELVKLRDYVEKQRQLGRDITIPERVLKTLDILQRREISQLSNSEIADIIRQLEALEQLGKTKQRTLQNLYDIEKENKLQELLGNVVPIEKHPMIRPRPGEKISATSKFKNSFRYLLNTAQHMDISITPMDVFFDLLGGSTGTYETAPSQLFKNNLDTRYQAYVRRKDEIMDPVYELMDTLKLEKENFDKIGMHAARMQRDGREKLRNSGFTDNEIDDLVLTDAEMQMYNKMRETLDELRMPIAEHLRAVENKELGTVENYFSFLTDWDAMSDVEVFQRFGEDVEEIGQPFTKTVEKGFTIERTGAGDQKIKIDALDVFTRHIDNVSYMLELGREIKMLGEIANSPRFKELAGGIGQKVTLEYMDLMARKGGKANDQKIAVLDMLRRNVGVAYLGFKLSSALIQPTALMDGASLIGNWAFTGTREFASSKRIRRFLVDNFEEIRIRGGDDPAFLELSENQTIKQTQEAGYWALKKLDLMAASSIGWGAYRQNLAKRGKKIDMENPDKEALEYAQKMVRRTQSSSLFKDAPLAISRGGLTGNKSFDRALFQFQSFLLTRWSRIRHDAWRAGFKKGKVGKGANIFLWMILATLAEVGVWRTSREVVDLFTGEDTEEQEYSRDVAVSLLGQVPYVSQLVSVSVFRGDPIPSFGAIRSLGIGASQLSTGKDETKIRGLVNLAESAGATSGVPGSRQLSQILRGMINSSTETTDTLNDLDLDLETELDLDLELE